MAKPEDEFEVAPAKPGRQVPPLVPSPSTPPVNVPKPVIVADVSDNDDGSDSPSIAPEPAEPAPQHQAIIETGPEEVIRQGRVVAHGNFLHEVEMLAKHYPLYAPQILKFRASLEMPGKTAAKNPK